MNDELDILGFDPSQLAVFAHNEESAGNVNKNLYVTRPSESKSEDGVYRSTIKVIYSPQNFKNSIIAVQSYSMQDKDGYFSAPSSLMVDDKSCPIFTAWKKCHYADKDSALWKQAASEKEGGKSLFDKRFARYVTIQVMEDKNHPELEGRYMFWKLPKSIWEMIEKKQKPAPESGKCPVPVMDLLFGYAIELEVTPGPDDPKNPQRKTRETSYSGEFTDETVSCTNPDKSPLLNDDEQEILDKYVKAMKKVWKEKDAETRAEMLAEVNADPNTKQLRKIYARVLEEIKGFCPDVNAEYGYKPWDENLARRVQNWIDIVLACGNPASATTADDKPKSVRDEDETEEPADTPAPAEAKEDDDDLPF